MPIALSARVKRIKPSPTLAVTARAAKLKAEGLDIIGLGAGEPDFDTPAHIAEAGIRAIKDGFTRYTNVDGIPELKDAIIQKFQRDNALAYSRAQILVSAGAKHTIYNLVTALLNPGDEVVIPAPYWVSYPDMVLLADGTPVIVSAGADQGYKITPQQLEAAITPKTRLFILNSPSNPTGAAYTRAELVALGAVLSEHPQIVIGTDDMYEHIWWGPERFTSFAEACPTLYDRTVTINGVSKSYAMTGWRIGYAGGAEILIKKMGEIQGHSTSNPCSISQAAAVAALNGPQEFLKDWVKTFQERRDLVVELLNLVPGISCPKPQGAFYVYPSCAGVIGSKTQDGKIIATDDDFATYLLQSEGVAVVQGSGFGLSPAFRISYATSTDALREACTRIRRACENLSGVTDKAA